MQALRKGYNNRQIEKKIVRSVKNTITTFKMFLPGDSVLVGVSGGPDSVALLHILVTLAPEFSLRIGLAHLNHSLRQKESDADAKFVLSLAGKLSLPCHIDKQDVRGYQLEKKLSLEEAAIHLRYLFYERIAIKDGFNKIALGHQSEDNAELVLMNIFRGSGQTGLSGIPPVRASRKGDAQIVRPLIRLSRPEIIDYLDAKGLKYVTDRSNKNTIHLRNRIRHHLIPDLKASYNPNIIDTLNRLSSIMRSDAKWIENITDRMFESFLLDIRQNKIVLSANEVAKIDIAAGRRVIRKALIKIKGDLKLITFSHIESTLGLLKSRPAHASLDLPGRIRIQLNRDRLIISREKVALRNVSVNSTANEKSAFEYSIFRPRKNRGDFKMVFIKETGMRLKLSEINLESIPHFSAAGDNVAFFDMDLLSFPLVLRNLRKGDRFNPLGMKGTQKVKKYFINKKTPRSMRSKCPLLLSGEKIIWVVGHRIDESVKITNLTVKVLKAELFLA